MTRQTDIEPRATIVIEWENIQLAEHSRCLEMLRRLSRQIDEVHAAHPEAGPLELILLYNNEDCSDADLHAAVDPYFTPAKPHCRVRFEAAPGQSYYKQKNRGAELAAAEIVVFIDSDVIPEDGWLAGLLSPFSDKKVQFVCGNSYLAATDLYSKTFALFWFFPLRATKAVFETKRTFFANNFAMRRNTMLKHPFVPVSGTTRGWCLALAHHLRENGIEIYYNSAAQVSHPAPFGISHFVKRALAQGRDLVIMRHARGKGGILRNFHKVALLPFRATWKIVRNRRQVGLSLVETPAALAIALAYNLLAIGGYLLTLVAPGYTRRRWHI